MKRLLLTLAAGAFGSLMVLPIAHAQSWQDMRNDARRIQRDNAGIRYDRQEWLQDIRNGRYRAAAREQTEIAQRKADREAWRNDLNNDVASRYRDDDSYGRFYRHDDDNYCDDDDD
jgi:hypothetical protein